VASYQMPLTMAVHSVGSNQPTRCATVYFEAKPRRAIQPVIDAAWGHSITCHIICSCGCCSHFSGFSLLFPGVPEYSHSSDPEL